MTMRQNKISLTKDGLVHEPGAVQLHAVEGRMRNAPTLQEPAHHARLSYTEEHKQLSVRCRYFYFMLIQNQYLQCFGSGFNWTCGLKKFHVLK